ncbi:DUF3987 domain-containing protein [Planctomicrobium sp. SH668]|uniref:YfjI family protein n=1 Tax=Planctomicrobium sp. SH668 TaxID=3448126 RepID=UPI003F5BD522
MEQRHGRRFADWNYYDKDGHPIGAVVRWDNPDGKKDIRPISLVDGVWKLVGMAAPRPLYCLPEVADADCVLVCEGEKSTDAVRSLGFVATTSVHGSNAAKKTDWSPLAGKEVIILPDNDESGERYADDVASLLGNLKPPARIKIARLPNLPIKGDAADWLETNKDRSPQELREELNELLDAAELVSPPEIDVRISSELEFQHFPVELLPEPIRSLVLAGANSIGCDQTYIALPVLTVIATAIGTTRKIRLKQGWDAPSTLWTAVVGESGTAKTPAFKLALKPMRDRQQIALQRHADAMKEFDIQQEFYERAIAEWKKNKRSIENPPKKPKEPRAERCLTQDATVEALAPLLRDNPRGILMASDELSGWFGSFDKYTSAKGSDSAHWLSLYSGVGITIDRKSGNPKTIVVPDAAVSITGGIQPGILRKALSQEHRESGLAARLMLASPPRIPKRWTDTEIDPALVKSYSVIIDRIFDKLHHESDEDGRQRPVIVEMTPEAKIAWVEYYNAHAREQAELTGDLSAAWSKLEEVPARLALILHYARWAADDPTLADLSRIDRESMESGIRLSEWFKYEARRVYSQLEESESDRARRRLVDWIRRKGGVVTARDVVTGCRWIKTASEADDALNGFVQNHRGRWENLPAKRSGGRPTRQFILHMSAASASAQSTVSNLSESSADADSVTSMKTSRRSEVTI